MPYVARRPLTVHGQQVGMGEEVDMSAFARPESMIRSGKVVWVGDGPRDKIVPEEFTKPAAKTVAPKAEPKPVEAPAKTAPIKTAAKKTVAKKTTTKPPAKKAAAT